MKRFKKKAAAKQTLPKFYYLVWACAKTIPRGKVASYAHIARGIGSPSAARAVGNALNKNPYRDVPCHRVIKSDGSLGGFARGRDVKLNLLLREGIKIVDNKVDPKYII